MLLISASFFSYSVEYIEDSLSILPLDSANLSISDDDNIFLYVARLAIQNAGLPNGVVDRLTASASTTFSVEGSGSTQLTITAAGPTQFFTFQADFVTFLRTVAFDTNDQAPFVVRNLTVVVQEFPIQASPPSLPAVVPIIIVPVNDRPAIVSIQQSQTALNNYIPESQNTGFSPAFLLGEADVQDIDRSSPDAPDIIGLALTATTNGGLGEWMYWYNGSWVTLPPVSECSPWLVLDGDRLRFSPSASPNKVGGEASIVYRAWDGTPVDNCVGGSRQFTNQSSLSSENETFTYDVEYLNRAPSTRLTIFPLSPIVEDTPTNSSDSSSVADIAVTVGSDPDDLYLGLAVVGADSSGGHWEYWYAGTWVPFPDQLTRESALLLSNETVIRFNPNTNYFGPASFQALVWDLTDNTTNTTTSDPYTGAFSSNSVDITISVKFVNDPPVLQLTTPTVIYTEGGSAVQLLPNLTISDVDDTALAWVSILLECPLCDDDDRGAGSGSPISESGFSLSPNTSDMIIARHVPSNFIATLERSGPQILDLRVRAAIGGDSSTESFSRYLRGLFFTSSDSEPSNAPRLVTLTVSDGTNSTTAQLVVRVELVNDERPVLILPYPSITWIEDSGPLALFSSPISVLDTDDNSLFSLAGATLELRGHDPTTESLEIDCSSFGLLCNFSGGALNITGSQSISTYEEAISAVVYRNIHQEPYSSPREVYIIVDDGMFVSDRHRLVVEVILINDQLPVIVVSSQPVVFREANPESSPVLVAPSASLSDNDSGVFSVHSATVTLLDAQNMGEEGLVLSSYPSELDRAHTLTLFSLTGIPLLTLQDALQMVEYFNTAAQPLGNTRLIEIVVYDNLTLVGVTGNNPVSVSVVFQLVDDLPEVRLNGDIIMYNEGQEPSEVFVALDGEIVDVDDNELSGLVIQLMVNGSINTSQERISVSLEGLDHINAENFEPLLINLTRQASLTNYTGVLRSLTYQHLERSGDPDSGLRWITVTPISLGGLPGVADVVRIAFSSVNNAPVVDLNGPLAGLNYETLFVEDSFNPLPLVAPIFNLVDVDSATLAYTRITLAPVLDEGQEFIEVSSTLPSIMVQSPSPYLIELQGPASVADFRAVLATLAYENVANEPNTSLPRVVSVEVSDGELSGFADTTVTIIPRNDLPEITLQLEEVSFVEGTEPQPFAVGAVVSDPDSFIVEYRVRPEVAFSGDIITGPGLSPVPELGGVFIAELNATSPQGMSQILGEVLFSNDLPEPPAGNRVFCLSVRDHSHASSAESCITILFQPVNDNPPLFDQDSYMTQVIENRVVNNIIQVSTTDEDSANSNVTLVYSILSGNDCSPSTGSGASGSGGILVEEDEYPCGFVINMSTGYISVMYPLDREMRGQHTLTVTVSDGEFETHIQVVIDVLDEIDIAPYFDPASYEVTVPLGAEVGLELTQLVVIDADLDDPTSIFQLSMNPPSGRNAFLLEGDTGRVLLNRAENQLDPTISQYTLTFEATDSAFNPSSNAAVLIIRVTLNQEPPVFVMDSFTAVVSESFSDQFMLTVSASDSDTGPHGEFIYTIPDLVPFSVDEQTGVITVVDSQSIDYEVTQQYQFSVVATDSGRPQMSSTAMVILNVTNENDNAPTFQRSRYKVAVCESAPTGLIILQLEAQDEDGDLTPLNYSLVELGASQGCIALDAYTGILTLVRLDFEQVQSLLFSVRVSDGRYEDEAELVVTVMNDNEYPPQFRFGSPLSLMVAETYQVGTPLPFPLHYLPLANDSDSCDVDQCKGSEIILNTTCSAASNLVYSIISGNEQEFFEINPSTGLVSLTQSLDFDIQAHREFNLSLLVTDGQLEDVTELRIAISDSDDNNPIFQNSSYSATIPESTPVGTTVLAVVAMDLDPTDTLTYSLAGEGADRFSIGVTSGLVQVSAPLDFETVTEYSLVVGVTDRPSSTDPAVLVDLTITVTNVNDIIPRFTQDEYNLTVVENRVPPVQFPSITAQDEDGPELSYSIISTTPPSAGDFYINTLEGLVLNVFLDREVQAEYLLTVQVEDNGSPLLSSTALVRLLVEDLNDNVPMFVGGNVPLVVTIVEGNEEDVLLLTLYATDLDENELTFSIDSASPFNNFTLDPQTGELFAVSGLDYESVTSYTITVRVTDNGESSRSSTRQIEVNIIDLNDNAPYFDQLFYNASLVETAPINTIVLQVRARDDDAGPLSSMVIHYFDRDMEIPTYLDIDPTTGDIFVIGPLPDVESTISIHLIVHAVNVDPSSNNGTDEYGPIIYDVVTSVTISLEDELVDAPKFTMEVFTVSIPEDFTPVVSSPELDEMLPDSILTSSGSGTVFRSLIFVTATDRNDPATPEGQLTYSIINPEIAPFIINSATGEILVTSLLNREGVDFYTIAVRVQDNGFPAYESVATVQVSVTDINDNAPMFDQVNYSGTILENQLPSFSILSASAFDLDANENSQLQYYIVGSSVPFQIDPLTGEIQSTRVFDREVEEFLNFQVYAVDSGTEPLSTTVTVLVTVLDVNDNAPTISPTQLNLTLRENVALGTIVQSFTITDIDVGANTEYSVSLSSHTDLFSVNDSGVLAVSGLIDYETVQEFSLIVVVRSRVPPHQEAIAEVMVIVENENDNPPVVNFLSPSVQFFEGSLQLDLSLGITIVDDDGQNVTRLIDGIIEFVNPDPSEPSKPFSPTTKGLYVPYEIQCPMEAKDRKFTPCLIPDTQILSRNTEDNLRTVRLDADDVAEDTIIFDSTQMQYARYFRDVPTLDSNGLTISTWVWVTPTPTSPDPLTLLAKVATSQLLYAVLCTSNGSLEFQYWSGGSTRTAAIAGVCSMLSGAWHHLALVIDNSDPAQWRINVFIDGEELVYQDMLQLEDGNGRVFIGARPQGGLNSQTEYYFNGRLHLLTLSSYIADRNRIRCVIGCGIYLLPKIENSPLTYYYNYSRRALIVEGTQPIGPYEDFLNSLVVVVPFNEPRVSSYQLSYTVQDDVFNCLPTFVDIIITPTNDFAPQLSLNGDTSVDYFATFVEEAGPVAALNQTSFFLTDMDLVAFEYSVRVQIQDPLQSAVEEVLAVQNIPEGMNVTYDPTHILTLTGLLPLPMFEAVLRTITYDNTADEPVGMSRSIMVTVLDPPEPEATALTTISIIYINDPPELVMVSTRTEYSEGDGAVPLLLSVVVSDSDNSSLASASVTFNALDGAQEILYAETSNTSIAANYDTSSSTLVLIGRDSLENYARVLLSIRYEHSSMSDPTLGTREFQFVLFDGLDEGPPEPVSLFFTAINDAPVIDLNGVSISGRGFAVQFIEDLSQVVTAVSPNATIVDVDNISLTEFTITLSPILDPDQESLVISIPNQVRLQVVENGNQLILQPVSGSSAPLQDYEAVLHSIQYSNTAEEPTPGIRTITFTANDGVSTSAPADTTVRVVAANDPPILDLDTATQGNGYEAEDFFEGGIAVYITARSVEVSDNDAGDTVQLLTVTIQNLMDGFDERIESDDLNITVPPPSLVNSASLTYMFNVASSSVTDIASLLTSLQYLNTRSEPTPGQRVITVAISDGMDFSITSITTVQVVGINENAPAFTQNVYSSAVFESQVPPILVTVVTARDVDDGIDGEVTYNIFSSSPNAGLELFAINETTGEIFTVATLDRETQDNYILVVAARDGGQPQQTTTAVVVIQLLDTNDNPPIFLSSNLSLTVVETSPVQFVVETVQVSDADLSQNGQFILETVLNQDTPFTVDVGTRNILVTRSLDLDGGPEGCEGNTSYILTIVATDLGVPMLSSEVNYSITVLDVNDNAPVFATTEWAGSVEENQPAGTSILMVGAVDRDCTYNAEITYTLRNSSAAHLFTVDPSSGIISSVRSFDYEVTESHQLTVIATDGGNPRMSSTAQVLVNIIDINDNAPVFSESRYDAEVKEGEPTGTVVVTVLAADSDTGSNGEIRYSIVSNSDVNPPLSNSPLFEIDAVTGEVVVGWPLDFELQQIISFTVVATDSGSTPLTSSATVTIQVTDVNDNRPVFTLPYIRAEVTENEGDYLVATVVASDSDSGANGDVSYRLVNNPYNFLINATSGEIHTIVGLDFEAVCYFLLTVEASDAGTPSLNATAEVEVVVLNVNDNSPIFNALVPQNNNDNPPTFTDVQFAATITENNELHVSLARIIASDLDLSGCNQTDASSGLSVSETGSGLYDSGMGLDMPDLFFQISPPSQFFDISTEGFVVVTGHLDREVLDTHNLLIQVSDGEFTTTASLRVIVNDVNDNRPEFLQPLYQAVVAENSVTGTIVLQVQATDPDIDSNTLVYSLVGSPTYFDIDSTTGVIFVSGVIDFESVGHDVAFLAAVNDSVFNSFVSVNISVSDLPDLPPVIQTLPQPLIFTEGQGSLRPFPNLTIFDPDSSYLCGAYLTLSSPQANSGGESSQCVCTDPRTSSTCTPGCLEFLQLQASAFPGEQVQQTQNGFELTLTGNLSIGVYESALESVEYVNILFDPIPEPRSISLHVSDCQLPSNPLIQSLNIQPLNVFRPELDLDGDSPGLDYQTSFTERGDPVSIVSQSVTITDQDTARPENVLTSLDVWLSDPPDLTQESIFLPLGSQLPSGVSLVTHSPHNLSFSGVASLEAYTASLLLLRYGNQASEPEPSRRIISFRAHEYMLSSEVTTTEITIVTINDFAPDIIANPPQSNYITTYTEGSPGVGVVRSDVIIEDLDSTNDMVIELQVYILSAFPGDQLYVADNTPSLSPLISFTQTSDSALTFSGSASRSDYEAALRSIQYRYTGDEFEFLFPPRFVFLQVSDQSLSGFSVTQVQLSPINDHLPIFTEPHTMVSVQENTTAGTSLVQLQYTDADAFTLTEPHFFISSGNADSLFSITPDTGIVVLDRPLDFEMSSSHSFTVELTDAGYQGPPASNAVAMVTVTVGDVNEHTPMFSQDVYNSTINEGAPIGTSVVQVGALDLDGEAHSNLQFDISTTDFTISSDGVVATNAALDQETLPSYQFLVMVRNPGSSAFDAAQVFVTILDLDDQRPIITLSPAAVILQEPETFTLLATSLTITDRDSNPSLDYAIVALLDSAPGWLLSPTSAPGITITGNSSSQLLFQGTSRSLSDFEEILRGVAYVDPSEEPLVVIREIAYVVGLEPVEPISLNVTPRATISLVKILTVSVEVINDQPPLIRLDTRDPANVTLTLANCTADGSFSTSFIEDGLPARLSDPSLSITDADEGSNSIAMATVELLAAPDGDLESLHLPASEAVELVPELSSRTRLVLSAAATSDIEAALLTVVYSSASQAPRAGTRVVRFTVNDGLFISSSLACVRVTGVNDPPQLTLGSNRSVDVMQMYMENQAEPLVLAPLLDITGIYIYVCMVHIIIHTYVCYTLLYIHMYAIHYYTYICMLYIIIHTYVCYTLL